jgi:putative endonuclease
VNSAQFFVYIMSSRSSTLYTGFTNDLLKRVYEHKERFVDGFTKRYSVNRLVYYEVCESAESALLREKQIKGWTRAKKIELVESINPEWNDLSIDLMDYARERVNLNKPVIKRGIPVLRSNQRDSSRNLPSVLKKKSSMTNKY